MSVEPPWCSNDFAAGYCLAMAESNGWHPSLGGLEHQNPSVEAPWQSNDDFAEECCQATVELNDWYQRLEGPTRWKATSEAPWCLNDLSEGYGQAKADLNDWHLRLEVLENRKTNVVVL